MTHAHRVVIVGGGFGGLEAAKALGKAPVEVTLIDRRNFHLFQPLLYQVATSGLSPANIAQPLRGILKRYRNVDVVLGEVVDIRVDEGAVVLRDGATIAYDSLIVSTGATHHYFGNDAWAEHAPGLKTIENATEIRSRMLRAFEAAEREGDTERAEAWLTFVIVGAGPTGVELAGALAEIAKDTLRYDFRHIDPTRARILLVEGVDRVLPPYPPDLSRRARASLEKLGVEVRTGTMVSDIQPDSATLTVGDASERIATHTVIWAAGVKASPLGQVLADRTGADQDRPGRIVVEPDCTVPGHPEIFVVGDLAHHAHESAEPLPGVAPVAIQQGRFAARAIQARLMGKSVGTFRYLDLGNMAVIGRHAGVADIRGLKLSGYLAWLAWLFIHLMKLVGFQNRALVFMQWAWRYLTHNRTARLITHRSGDPRSD
ncbi:MAG: NAD(P)/FAD-dependent oxidoreductase [Candidatus Bipolaricaulia bacterium]